jgi:hypothetical protein
MSRLRGGAESRTLASKRKGKTSKLTVSKAQRFTVPEVWRTIAKKNDRQGDKLFDVLVCQHAVPSNDNRYRKARSCPECRIRVQKYADALHGRR